MLRARSIVACAAALLALATGCTPVVQVHHAEVRGVSMGGLSMVAHLTIQNENAFDIELQRVRANVTMADRYPLTPVDIQPKKWLVSGRKTRVAVPITVPWTSIPGILAASVGSSTVPFHIQGVARVSAGRKARFRANYPIDDEGTVPRSTLAQSAPGGLPLPF
jgi:LEA14-like dessication related protein